MNGAFNYYDLKQKIEIIKCDIKNYSEVVNKETNHLNNIYNINKYLKYNTLALDKDLAYKCGIIKYYPYTYGFILSLYNAYLGIE